MVTNSCSSCDRFVPSIYHSRPPTQRAYGHSVSPHLEKLIKPRQNGSADSSFVACDCLDFLGVDPQSVDPQVSESPNPTSVVRDSLHRQSVDPYRWVSRQMHNQQPKISLGGLGRARRDWVSACWLLVCWLYWLLAASHIMMIIITIIIHFDCWL